jgi:hypothetical protein
MLFECNALVASIASLTVRKISELAREQRRYESKGDTRAKAIYKSAGRHGICMCHLKKRLKHQQPLYDRVLEGADDADEITLRAWRPTH